MKCLNCNFESDDPNAYYGVIDDNHLVCVDCWEIAE